MKKFILATMLVPMLYADVPSYLGAQYNICSHDIDMVMSYAKRVSMYRDMGDTTREDTYRDLMKSSMVDVVADCEGLSKYDKNIKAIVETTKKHLERNYGLKFDK